MPRMPPRGKRPIAGAQWGGGGREKQNHKEAEVGGFSELSAASAFGEPAGS